MNNNLQDGDGADPAGLSAETRQAHWVQCDHSLRLAVQHQDGTWRSFSNNRELTDFVRVCGS
jgi:hypothetical protein